MSSDSTDFITQSREFVGEVQVELKKVTWPTQKETIAGTIGVAAIVGVIATALFGVDYVLSLMVQSVLG